MVWGHVRVFLSCFFVFLLLFQFLGTSPAAPAAEYAGALPDSLAAAIEEARVAGHYADALALARPARDELQTDPSAQPWAVGDAGRLVDLFERILALPALARQELAAADALLPEITRLGQEGDHAAAADLAARRHAALEHQLGPAHPEVADAAFAQGSCLVSARDFPGAEGLFLAALAVRREVLEPEHPAIAENLKELARLCYRKGDFKGAEPLLREALVIARAVRGDEHLDTAKYLYDLGAVLMGGGHYAAAEPLFRQALVLHRKLLQEDHPKIAHNLNALGVLLKRKGDLEAAEPIYRQALEMRRRLLPADHPDIAWSLSNLAGLLCDRGDYTEAEPLLRQALAMQKRRLGEDAEDLDIAQVLHNLAHSLRYQERLDEAEELFREALRMTRKILGEDNQFTVGILHSLANVVLHQGELAEAEQMFTATLASYRKVLGEEHQYVAWALADFALCLQAQGDLVRAEQLLAEASSIFETARLRAGSGFARSTFQASPYSQLAAVRLLQGEDAEAWPAAERALGRSLADLLMAAGQRSLTAAEVAREDSLQRTLGRLEGQLAALQKASLTDTTGQTRLSFKETRSRLLATEAAWAEFEREIAARYPVTEGQAFPLERIQRSLSPTTALVGWLHVGTDLERISSWGYIIRQEGPVHWVALEPSLIEAEEPTPADLATDLRETLTTAGSWPFRVTDVTRITDQAHRIWNLWLEPLLPHLAGAAHLVVVPSGPMLGVPVEALVDDEERFVGDRLAISYAPSATVFTWLWEQAAARPAPRTRRALLLGDPPFAAEHLSAMERERNEDRQPTGAKGNEDNLAHNLRGALAGDEEALAGLPRLPRTRDEVQRVAAVFPGATKLLGPQASEQEIFRLVEADKLREFDFIHLATHALVDDEGPERSALILSRTNLPDPLEATVAGERIFDGLLTMKEIVRTWQLDAELVCLSGCQTALGKKAGGEGYIGLVHAFLQAGARSLLVSLWRVEDEATALLMSRFYENLTGSYQDERAGLRGQAMPKAAALSEAQRWLRGYTNGQDQRIYRHPAYWSGFVLIGDPR